MDAASTAWILASFTAVSLMVPGLALFYGGMVGSRSMLNMIMMVFGAVATGAVVWTLYGYSAVFGDSYGGLGLLGDITEHAGLTDVLKGDKEAAIPPALFAAFQALFAALTVGIIAGALVDRVRFGAWIVFSALWVSLVYLPIGHWVFSLSAEDGSLTGGWILNRLAAVDFAGGTAVHINSGAAGLAAVLALGARRGWPRQPRPNSIPFTVLGGGILFFGWFGFNGGSALASGNSASVVVLTTMNAAFAAMLVWLLVERIMDKHATALGAASGLIAGLVAITPACGAVSPMGALAVGAIAGALCPLAIRLKYKLGYDDSLDVVGVHLVGGVAGTLMVGLLATPDAPSAATGLFYGGGFRLLGVQAVAALAVLAYSFVVTWLLVKAIDKTMGMRLEAEAEENGVDVTVHGEVAWDLEGAMYGPAPKLAERSREVVESAEALASAAAERGKG
ncbi:ammonium transporter [Streptomyces sp. PSKA54]|uniref:Ammonium transporter n=1 Tax=Streptomyces himalayensis subsp. aureolus TaxID=2758039 RepID=A0A7W2HJ12_9ACTN|nr:ammonium transporter [Streptomyces himalayensis]MBA4865635.1 ammonium transporter [Streptomyces himalayensis subsp. aureolus]